jgi:hypothetical protein
MVNTIQSGADWQPRFAPQALQPLPETQPFNLSPDSTEAPDEGFSAFGADGFTLLDAVDIINPLQHIPLIGNLYRDLTGDTLDPFSRVAGSTLFFGPLGTAVSTANVAMEEFTGKDIGGHMLAFLKDTPPAKAETQVAGQAVQEQAPITPAKPTAAGTDSLDPVTAWAMNEITYRNEQAVRLGMAVPVRSYSDQLTQMATAQPVEISAVVAPSQWSKPVPDGLQALASEPAETPQTAPAASVPPSEFIPVNAFQAEHRASPTTLLRLKQSTAAYKTVDFPGTPTEAVVTDPSAAAPLKTIDVPGSETRAKATAATPSAATAYRTVDFPTDDTPIEEPPAPVAATASPASAVPASALASELSPQAAAAGAVSTNGSWFTASMLDALGKYKAAQTPPSGQPDPLTTRSSLH